MFSNVPYGETSGVINKPGDSPGREGAMASGPVSSAAGGIGVEGKADSPTRRGFATQGLQRRGELALKPSARAQVP